MMKKEEYAKPCPKCNGYYPGDCFDHGCKDPLCECDGCTILRSIEYENEVYDFEAQRDYECQE